MSTARTPLTPERIVAAALELIDQDGLDALSMRHLGGRLDVEAMSLYGHVPSKAALMDAIAAHLLDGLALPAPTPEWQPAFREGARAYRRLLMTHPNAIPLFARLQLTNRGAVRAAGAVMALLRGIGLDAPTALQVLSTMESYIVGFALWEAGTAPFRSDPAYAAPLEPWQLPPGADPYLVELAPQLARTSCDESFEFGLDLIVAGLERRLGGG